MATLDVTIKESVTLNGKDRGSENVLSITSVNEVLHRIVTCPANQDTTVAVFKSALFRRALLRRFPVNCKPLYSVTNPQGNECGA
jgi:hypothetical protein